MSDDEPQKAEPSEAPAPAEETRANVPNFARGYPRTPELDALVLAFARGDFAKVRAEAAGVAARAEDEAVKNAALELRSRIEADPMARVFFLITLALLLFLTAWWMAHDGKAQGVAPEVPAQAK